MSDPMPPVSSTYELYPHPPMEIVEEPEARQRYWIHALLLLGTLFTMLVTGARMNHNFTTGASTFLGGDLRLFPIGWIYHNPSELLGGIPFALTLILILLCHEMGHYLYCVYYGVDATLPFFIPFPSPIGTLGAFIRIQSKIRSRSALFDIGIAGPIAGFVASLVVLACALPFSRALPPDAGSSELGLPVVFNIVYFALGKLGIGIPAKLALQNVALHPAAIAAWVGMFATSLNLLPGGQLDGGHIVYALIPRWHRWISRLSIFGLVLMMYFWLGWGLWAVLLRLSGGRHPQVAPWPDITRGRKWLSIAALIMLVLTFVPAPFAGMGLKSYVLEFLRR
jgi:membrane-associated protease RseP (regulator of RpoE activity)